MESKEEFQKLRVEGYKGNTNWYMRDNHYFLVTQARHASVVLRCADVLCPARWTQKINPTSLGPVYPDHNHKPHTWMGERNIMFVALRQRALGEDTPIRTIYKEEAAKYPIAAERMRFSMVSSSLRAWRRKAMQKKGVEAKKVDVSVDDSEVSNEVKLADESEVSDEVELFEDGRADTPEVKELDPLETTERDIAPKDDNPKIQTSNFFTVLPQVQNQLCNNSILVSVGGSNVATTIPQLVNSMCTTNTTQVPQLDIRSSSFFKAIPQMMTSLCPNTTVIPQIQVRRSDLVTVIPQTQNPLCSTISPISRQWHIPGSVTGTPQLEGSDLDTTVPQDSCTSTELDPKLEDQGCERQDQLFELFSDDPDPAAQSEEPLYQLFDDDPKSVLPQDPLFEKCKSKQFAVDPDPAPRTEDPLYQLSDNNVNVLSQGKSQFFKIPQIQVPASPRVKEGIKVCIIKCRACSKDVPYYAFIPCGHVICRKCFKLRKMYRMCFVCSTAISSAIRMLF